MLKPGDSAADATPGMPAFSPELWVLLALVGGAAVLGVLGRIAQAIEDEKSSHLAQIKAEQLRRHYAAQLASKIQGEIIEVDEVQEAPVAEARAA
jgi:hypothetical protein